MSSPLVSRSSDLQQLQAEGFEVEVRSNYLLVKHVPFVTSDRKVALGTLISELSTSGSTTTRPADHVVSFSGGVPCDDKGAQLTKILNSVGPIALADGLTADCRFSSKPPQGYPNYYVKMTTYIYMLEGPAQAIDPTATSRTFAPTPTAEDESVFRYLDAASSRARITAISEKLAIHKVAIIGLGGTGAYILDLIAKTLIDEIHLYDADIFYTHNAFRAPGAASIEELDAALTKVEYYRRRYDPMRRSIVAHPVHIDDSNVAELRDMTFVFLAMDTGPAKKMIVEKLEEFNIPFIDSGMGVYRRNDTLGGIVRVTTSLPGHRAHGHDRGRISFASAEDDEYDKNIQLADLNMFNAALAVMKWKKLYGVYDDTEHELFTAYTIGGNQLLNDDETS